MSKTGDMIKTYILLHSLLLIYSLTSVVSKLAGNESFLSIRFWIYFSGVIILLGVYAIGWQQVIKKLPLTTAFANKALTIVWGIVWGFLIFNENVTKRKLFGAGIVMLGVVFFAFSDRRKDD